MKRVSWLKAGHSNTIFSVRDIVSGTDGAVLQSYEYRENGEKTSSTSLKSDKTWVGGLSVNDDTGDSGLYLMGHRHYDASLGRFLSRDPIGFAGGLNLYEYAASSPVTMTDALGLQSTVTEGLVQVTAGAVMIVGGAAVTQFDGPFSPAADPVGIGIANKGRKQAIQGVVKVINALNSPIPGSQPKPSPNPSPGPSPKPPCPDEGDGEDDDLIFSWRNQLWRADRDHFWPSVLDHLGSHMTPKEFQNDWLWKGRSQRAGGGHSRREIWHISQGKGDGLTGEMVVEPIPRVVRGVRVSGSLVTIRRSW